ncbi:hypothetical protein N431DRAFT_462708 [Stipitochalara longipes BDJ]|nr:hypothetical protein N431DRAFT_462708 [Stipitochalara longipes BDJ]
MHPLVKDKSNRTLLQARMTASLREQRLAAKWKKASRDEQRCREIRLQMTSQPTDVGGDMHEFACFTPHENNLARFTPAASLHHKSSNRWPPHDPGALKARPGENSAVHGLRHRKASLGDRVSVTSESQIITDDPSGAAATNPGDSST